MISFIIEATNKVRMSPDPAQAAWDFWRRIGVQDWKLRIESRSRGRFAWSERGGRGLHCWLVSEAGWAWCFYFLRDGGSINMSKLKEGKRSLRIAIRVRSPLCPLRTCIIVCVISRETWHKNCLANIRLRSKMPFESFYLHKRTAWQNIRLTWHKNCLANIRLRSKRPFESFYLHKRL